MESPKRKTLAGVTTLEEELDELSLDEELDEELEELSLDEELEEELVEELDEGRDETSLEEALEEDALELEEEDVTDEAEEVKRSLLKKKLLSNLRKKKCLRSS